MAEDKAIITEASIKEFEEKLQSQEAAVKQAEQKFLLRLVAEAKDSGVDFKDEKELLESGEKGIMKLIEQAKKLKVSTKVEEKAEIKETRGEIATEVQEHVPAWRQGNIKVQGNEMWSDWKEGYFRKAFLRAVCGKPDVEDY